MAKRKSILNVISVLFIAMAAVWLLVQRGGAEPPADVPAPTEDQTTVNAPASSKPQSDSQAKDESARTPAQILKALEAAIVVNPEDDSPEARRKAFVHAIKTVLLGADELLAHNDTTQEQKKEAHNYKLGALIQGTRQGIDGYKSQLSEFARQLARQDPKSDIAPVALFHSIHAKHSTPYGLGAAALDEIANFLKQFPGHSGGAELLNDVGSTAEMKGKLVEAKKAYGLILKHFGDDENLRTMAAGTIRRIDLPGKPMLLAGKNLDDKPANVNDLRGKVVLVDFWATWCGPCVASFPHLIEVYEKYHDRGFEIIGVPLDDDQNQLREFLENRELPWKQVLVEAKAGGSFGHPTAAYYGISRIPTMFLIGRSGNVVTTNVDHTKLEELVAAQIAKQSSRKDAGSK